MHDRRPSQFADQYDDIRLQVRVYLCHKFRRGVDVDDITDAVLEKLFVRWQQIDDPLAWAIAAARNLAVDQLRKAPVAQLEQSADHESLVASTFDVAEQQFKVDVILQALHMLSPAQNKAVILSALGYANPEIACIMRLTTDSVAHYLYEGRKKLEMILQYRRRKPKMARQSARSPGKN